jgi:hypothetical protein
VDPGDGQPVDLVVALDDAIPAVAAALHHLDTLGTVGRLHSVLGHRLHPDESTPSSDRVPGQA